MAPKTDAAATAQKWQQRLSAATTEIAAGVDAVTTAPGAAAAAQRAKWLAKVTASQDKWARNVARVSLDDWKTAMKTTGVQRVAQGAQAKQGKVESFLAEFLPYVAQGASQVRRMPGTTVEDGIARAAAMIRHNAAFKRSGG